MTRQKILNWRTSLKFPPKPQISATARNFIESLVCEPEDRLGSQEFLETSKPNSRIVQARRAGYAGPNQNRSGPSQLKV